MSSPTKTIKHAAPADFGVTDFAYKVTESDFNILRSLKSAPINQFSHKPDISYVATQQVIRENQDIIYSSAVVDISKGATFSLPSGDTYQIIQVIDMQNYTVHTVYPGESFEVTTDKVTYGNYVYLNMRTRPKSVDEAGLKELHARQRQAKIEANSAIEYVSPDIVVSSDMLDKIRGALIADVDAGKLADTTNVMGTPYNTDPQGALYAAAYGWGGLPIADAGYGVIRNQAKVDGDKAVPSSVTFKPPQVDKSRGGFWSITTYNTDGWLARDRAAVFDSDVTPNDDGTVTVYFNTPDKGLANVDTPAHFAALFRAYVPASKENIVDFLRYLKKDVDVVIK